MRFEFVQTHGEFARAWLVEYYRSGKWTFVRVLGGPAMAYLGWRLHQLQPGTWMAALGSFGIGFGIYYALKPFLHVALLVRRRHKRGAQTTKVIVEVDGEDGIRVESGSASTTLGWDQIVRAGWRRGYLWFEVTQGSRAIIPMRAIADREALDAVFRDHGKLPA